jgi:hypothetical protein
MHPIRKCGANKEAAQRITRMAPRGTDHVDVAAQDVPVVAGDRTRTRLKRESNAMQRSDVQMCEAHSPSTNSLQLADRTSRLVK